MSLPFRAVLRGFLLVAGAYFLVTGSLDGNVLELLLGAAGVLIGGGGLYADWRSSKTADDDSVASDAEDDSFTAGPSADDTPASTETRRDTE